MDKRTAGSMLVLPFLVAACASSHVPYSQPQDVIRNEMSTATAAAESVPVAEAGAPAPAYPSLRLNVPGEAERVLEPRFDLVVNDAPIRQVLLGMVAETRYSMLLPPDLEGSVTVSLKNVTVPDAMSVLRQLYGYEYHIEGSRVFVDSRAMQTRIMKINYLNAQRKGTSDIRVISGSVGDSNNGNSGSSGNSNNSSGSSGTTQTSFAASKVSTTSESDFWADLATAVQTIVGGKEGRSVVVSPQSGVLVVRATPTELGQVERFLQAAQLSLDRQVIIEAKIVEVTLSASFQSGINWSAFGSGVGNNGRFSVGQVSPGSTISRSGTVTTSPISGTAQSSLANASSAAGSMFGMILSTANFTAVLNMLEEQGRVHVLSSPRIATLNNQKAVLKVGTDDFFLTDISTNASTNTNGSTTVTPKLTLQPFFSGILLDVTPQIDDIDKITLHVHPMVSKVSSVTQDINLGSLGEFKLPLASSDVSEMDSVVRAQDGQMIALGGLIRQYSDVSDSQLPGLGDIPLVGNLFKQKSRDSERRELVILLRPTIIQSSASWAEDIGTSNTRMNRLLDDKGGPGSRPQ
jgi:MSHA biogenesis protein MshL